MNKRITAAVTGEFIKLSTNVIGAAGAHNVTDIAFSFDAVWDGMAKTAYFWDAYGETSVAVILGLDLLDGTGAYIVPVPSEPLRYPGKMRLTLKGVSIQQPPTDTTTLNEYESAVGEEYYTVSRVAASASCEMTVLVSDLPGADNLPEDVTPSQAEQIQAQIEALRGDIGNAKTDRERAELAANAAEESAGNSLLSANEAAKSANESVLTAGNAAESERKAAAIMSDMELAADYVSTLADDIQDMRDDVIRLAADAESSKNAASQHTIAASAASAAAEQKRKETVEAAARAENAALLVEKAGEDARKGIDDAARIAINDIQSAAGTDDALREFVGFNGGTNCALIGDWFFVDAADIPGEWYINEGLPGSLPPAPPELMYVYMPGSGDTSLYYKTTPIYSSPDNTNRISVPDGGYFYDLINGLLYQREGNFCERIDNLLLVRVTTGMVYRNTRDSGDTPPGLYVLGADTLKVIRIESLGNRMLILEKSLDSFITGLSETLYGEGGGNVD